jgi:hypothetical protein
VSKTFESPAATTRRPFLHMPVPWVFVLAFLLGVGVQFLLPLSSASASLSPLVMIAGAVLFVTGAVVAGWGLVSSSG